MYCRFWRENPRPNRRVRSEHLAGLRAVAIEEALARLAKALRPLAPGAQRSVEGQVAEEVEGIGLGLAGDLAELGEVDAALLQFLDDLGTLRRVGPACAQRRRARAQHADLLAGVVGVPDHPELPAVRIELVDEMRRDLDSTAVEVELAVLVRWRLDDLGLGAGLGRHGPGGGGLVKGLGLPVPRNLLLGQPDRVAVEGGVGEQPGRRSRVVDDVEPELAVVVAHARAAADDLLELGHGADHTGEHHVLAGGHVDAPVVRSWEVVRMAGTVVSMSWKRA